MVYGIIYLLGCVVVGILAEEAVDPGNVQATISKVTQDENSCPSLDKSSEKMTVDEFSSLLTDPCRYDKLTKPDTDGPLNVTVQVDIRHIEAAEQLKFKMHMLIQMRYLDQRLNFENISRPTMLGEVLLRDKIWTPHIAIFNDKDSSIMGLDGKDIFVSINPKGEVIYSFRMTTTIYCWMDLKKFPFDEQTCSLNMLSWTYNASNLQFLWENEEPVKVANQLHLTEFFLARYWTTSELKPFGLSHSAFEGSYSILMFNFLLSRQVGYYVMDYFIPSIMLVITSWFTFWLQADNTAPRATLGTSTMLSFITLASGQSKNLPKVSYIKASEIWFLGCIIFIFASMVEFAFVNIIWRRKKKIELIKVNTKYILKSTVTPKLARKEFQRFTSTNSLTKSRSYSSLESAVNNTNYNNYLTVHSFPSTLNIPTITTQSEEDLDGARSKETMTTRVTLPGQAEIIDPPRQTWTTMTPQEISIWIDKRSRIGFPIAFLIFNIFYWSFVLAL